MNPVQEFCHKSATAAILLSPGTAPTQRGAPRSPWLIAVLALLVVLTSSTAGAVDKSLFTEADQALLVDAVEAAFELDLYNARCRSDQSGRRTENLNKALVSRYRMTVLDVLDDFFPEGYYRTARERMSDEFLSRLRDMGGCAGAKEANLRVELGARYDAAMQALSGRP